MCEALFQEDPYRRACEATVTAVSEDGVMLDRTVFYPVGGGQPGDCGKFLTKDGTTVAVTDTRRAENGRIAHVVGSSGSGLEPGDRVEARIDWARRYAHMRMHTCLHLLGAIVPFPVTGGNISAIRSRLDFDMSDTLDKQEVAKKLNALIESDLDVRSHWISQEELELRPELIRTLSVKPPRNVPRIRLLEIPGVDLQPCGGTHVARTGEIGPATIPKIEKKGRHNRRVHIVLA